MKMLEANSEAMVHYICDVCDIMALFCLTVVTTPPLLVAGQAVCLCLCVCVADAQQVRSARPLLGTPGSGVPSTIRAHPTGSMEDSERERERKGKLCSLRSARTLLIFAYFS